MKNIKKRLLSLLPDFIVGFFTRFGEIIRYTLCGLATTIVNFVVYLIVSRLIFAHIFEGGLNIAGLTVGEEAARAALWNTIAWIVSVLFSFFVNRSIVFHDKKRGGGILIQLLVFSASRILSGIFEIFAPSAMIELLHMKDLPAKFIVAFISVAVNYVFSKFVVFRKNKNSEEFIGEVSAADNISADISHISHDD